jgi:hypothetical protein
MSDGSDMPSREEAMLARLAELDLAAAEKAHAKLMAAEDTDEIDRLGRTYQRLSRSLRQTPALKARLARQREAAAAKLPPKPQPEWPLSELQHLTPPVRARIDRVRDAVMPYIEREDERFEHEGLYETELYDILIDLAQDDAFLDTPVEDLVAEVLEIMGLPTRPKTPPEPADPAPTAHNSA